MNVLTKGLGLVLCFTALILAPLAGAETLTNPRMIFTGSDPRALAFGDLNGDGKPDLVYIDGGFPGILHTLVGNGDGTFQRIQDIPLPQNIGGPITIGDVNNDGRPDIVLGSGGPLRLIATFMGNGDGTFGPVITSDLQINQFLFADFTSIAIADLNGDGAVDLVITDPQNDQIYSALGNNTGTFTLTSSIFNGGAPNLVLTADFNGDGHPDVLVRSGGGNDATVYLGIGDGTFQPGVRYTGPDNVTGVALADMDGDGHLDMVISGFSNDINVLHGNADGTFATVSSGGAAVPGAFSRLLGVADFNGDGIPDLVVSSGDGVGILLGQGNLAFAPMISSPAAPIAAFALTVFADFNLDGHIDVALPVPDGIALLLGRGDGSFNSFDTYRVNNAGSGILLGDFNGDAIPDLATGVSPSGLQLLFGTGTGKFTVASSIVPSPPPTVPFASGNPPFFTGDFNGDGKADVLFTNSNSIMFGNGDGTFSAPIDLSLSFPGINIFGATDVNHDGRSDIISFPQFQPLQSLLGELSNSFTRVDNAFPVPLFINTPVAFGDFNHDGFVDVVFPSFPNLQPMLGNGDGTFRLVPPVSTVLVGINPSGPGAIAVADFDGDGNPDIIISNGNLEIFYGRGDGTFDPPALLPSSRAFPFLNVADMNGDGKPDLVLADISGIAVIHNNGARVFGPEVHYIGGSIGGLVVKDLNGDGLPDVAVTGSNTVSVLLSQPAGPALNGAFSFTPQSLQVGQPLTFNLSLSPATATGFVIFSIDKVPLSPVPLVSGTASFVLTDTSALAVGAHSVSAQYSGDAAFPPAVFMASLNVSPFIHPTSVGLTASPNPALASQTIHFAITISSAGPTPTGAVAIHDGNVNLGLITLDPTTGTGVFDTALIAPGAHSITALYQGDRNSAPGTSAPVSVTVNGVATATTLTSLPPAPQTGSSVALTATVNSPSGTPFGRVSFFDGTVFLGTRALDSTGVAVLISTFSSPGTHSFSAVYDANGPFLGSTSAVLNLLPVGGGAASTTSLVVNSDPASTQLFLKASLRPGISGKVLFFSGSVPLGAAMISRSGMATLELAGVFPGSHYFTAMFPGSSDFTNSAATSLLLSPASSGPDFAMHVSAGTATLMGNTPASLQMQIDPLSGFSDDVALSCSSAAGVRCTFSPASLKSGGSSVVTLVLPSSRAGFAGTHSSLWPIGLLGIAIMGLLFVLFATFGQRRHALAMVGCLCLAAAVGCGGRVNPSAVPARTTAVTLTAASAQTAALSHSVTIEVTIAPSPD